MPRYCQASAIFSGDSTSPVLVVIGGRHDTFPLNDCWLFDNINTSISCKKVCLLLIYIIVVVYAHIVIHCFSALHYISS